MSASPHNSQLVRRLATVVAAAAILVPTTVSVAGTAKNRIAAVDAGDTGSATTIAIRGSRTPTFTVYKLQRPSRVVVDIANAELSGDLRSSDGAASFDVNSWGVSQVSAHALDGSQAVVRVVVRMARPGSYKVKAVGNDVVVSVEPRDPPPARVDGAAAKAEAKRARADAKQARAEAKRAREEASAAIARAEQQAATAREAERKAREQADSARLEASRAKADARRARDEATQARADASDAKRRAAERELFATKRVEEAKSMIAAADRKLAQARKSKQAAETLAAQADERAKVAEAASEQARRTAEAARAEAALLAKQAEKAARDGRGNVKQLEKKAAAAAAEAKKQRVAAARAEASAKQRRSEAQSAETRAQESRAAAVKIASKAQRERAEAETRRDKAERMRAEAEAALTKAEERRVAAEQQAKLADRRAGNAARELDTATKKVDQAEAEAGRLRGLLAKAQSRADELRGERNKAQAEAARLRGEKAATEARLTRVRTQARLTKAEVARLELERDRTNREIARLKQEQESMRAARKQEQARTAAAEAQLEQARAEAADARAQAKRATAEVEATRAESKRATAEAEARRATVRDVDYVDRGKVSRIVINLDGPAKPKVLSAKGTKAVLEIPGTSIDSELERTLDTTRYGGPITAVSSYRDPRDPEKVRVVVDLNKPTASVLKRKGTVYYWDFDKPAPTATKTAAATRSVPVRKGPSVGASTPITNQTVAQARSSRKRKVYRGRKIDLDFKDADIHNLLRLLADVGGVNIVIPDEIRASVTVRLRNVPWDQALEVILQSKGLWYRREGTLIRVAPRKLLDSEDKEEAERLAAMARSEAPEPEIFTLNYAVAGEIQGRLVPLLSPKGRIEVDARTNSLIISDIRAHRARIIELVSRLDTQTPQIQIEARIVEARSSFRREFGIQWGGNLAATQANGASTGLIFPSDIAVAGAADDAQTSSNGVSAVPTDFAVNMPAAIGGGSGGGLGFSFGSVGGAVNVNLRLSALEDTGSIRIVSAPKITTLNNIQANIAQGVSIPISVVSANGVQTQFVPADLKLAVTPHVSQRDCSIAMELEVTKNEADFANTGARGDPSLLRKEAKTSVLVADGETSVIGGIYTRSTSWSRSKVPFFADLPVIGWLFRNKTETDDRTEVLVFITPKITNRAFLRCE